MKGAWPFLRLPAFDINRHFGFCQKWPYQTRHFWKVSVGAAKYFQRAFIGTLKPARLARSIQLPRKGTWQSGCQLDNLDLGSQWPPEALLGGGSRFGRRSHFEPWEALFRSWKSLGHKMPFWPPQALSGAGSHFGMRNHFGLQKPFLRAGSHLVGHYWEIIVPGKLTPRKGGFRESLKPY